MRFRPANNSLIKSRSSPPTPLAAIVNQPCNFPLSEIFYHFLERLLTGPSITGWDKRQLSRAGPPFGRASIGGPALAFARWSHPGLLKSFAFEQPSLSGFCSV